MLTFRTRGKAQYQHSLLLAALPLVYTEPLIQEEWESAVLPESGASC